MLNARNLSARLGQRPVLKNISLCCAAGSLTAIVGPNGSGKTTLLRALSGDLDHSGEAHLNEIEIRKASPVQLAELRAVLAQSTQTAFAFSVLEIVRLGLVNGGGDARALEALARVGLAGYEGRPLNELSGGEQARVHLARVLAQVWHPLTDEGPRWLFLDEPVAALDIRHQLGVMRQARAFADQGGGVLAVMHDLNLSAMFADRILLLHDGEIVAFGPPDEVLTDANLQKAYGCELRVNTAPSQGVWILPQMALP